MSVASTTLTLGASLMTSSDNKLQQSPYYASSNASINTTHNNNNNNKSTYYYFPQACADTDTVDFLLNYDNSGYASGNGYVPLPLEDNLLLERTTQISAAANTFAPKALHKSNSYNGFVRPKATILKQDGLNGRIATSLTDDDIIRSSADYTTATLLAAATSIELQASENDALMPDILDEHAFLVSSGGASGGAAGVVTSNSAASSRRSTRGNVLGSSKARNSFCYRAHAFINRNWYLGYLVPLSILLALMLVAYLTRDYAKRLLYWIETQNPWIIFAIFMLLFVVVSFPIVVGYFVLMITSGYLFGCLKGFLTVILGANVGIAIAHLTIRSFRHRIPMHKLIKNETGRAILRVISGPKAFKVVVFTRLTPIPFGIQNAIFGVSSINPRIYHTATFLGLLPAQTINVYLGSTLRSMHEVLNNHGTAVTGYISFGVEVIFGVALMFWVVQKARKELSETLLSDISTEGKLIDIEV